MSGRRVLVIGLDGATFDLIKPWVKKRLLPNFAWLMTNGASGDLKSTIPPVTGPAWASFMTGKNPGKHGILGFQIRKGKGNEFALASRRTLKAQTLWKIVSNAGRKVVAINVPLTFPPEKINGYMISGMLTPSSESMYTYPSSLKAELDEKVGGYKLYWEESMGLSDPGVLFDEVMQVFQMRKEATLYLMKKVRWDFFTVVFSATDIVSHMFWRFWDPKHPDCYGKNRERYGNAILECYKQVDAMLGEMIKLIDKHTVLLIMSDHGMGPLYKTIHMNWWLMNQNLLALNEKAKRNPKKIEYWISKFGLTKDKVINWLIATRLVTPIHILMKATRLTNPLPELTYSVELSFSDIDWSRTKAYARGHMGKIYLNCEDREYAKLKKRLAEELLNLTDPSTGEKVVSKIFTREEIYNGDYRERAPDLVFLTETGYQPYNGLELNRNSVFGFVGGVQSSAHKLNGIFLTWGKGIRKGYAIEKASILDLAPTILHTLKIPIPKDMDGKVLMEVFDDDEMSNAPPT